MHAVLDLAARVLGLVHQVRRRHRIGRSEERASVEAVLRNGVPRPARARDREKKQLEPSRGARRTLPSEKIASVVLADFSERISDQPKPSEALRRRPNQLALRRVQSRLPSRFTLRN